MKLKNTVSKNYKKAKLWAVLLGKLPGVSAIFLSGSLATGNSKFSSDIDLFIISNPKQIFTSRFWVTGVLKLSNQLASVENHQGKICPNHFISAEFLRTSETSSYMKNLIKYMKPLYDPLNLLEIFSAKNLYPFKKIQRNKIIYPNYFEQWFERRTKKYQQNKINKINLSRKAEVFLTDKEIRLHPDPKRFLIKPKLNKNTL